MLCLAAKEPRSWLSCVAVEHSHWCAVQFNASLTRCVRSQILAIVGNLPVAEFR